MSTLVDYAYADGVARITFVDGDRGNPLSPAAGEQLWAAVKQARTDRARVVVIAAEGRFFSVGGDLASFADAPDAGALVDDLAEGLHRVISELMRSDAVVVSAVQGMAAGAGFPIAAAADVVIAADTARFTLAYTRAGLSPDGGSTLLVHTLGLHRVLRLALLNDVLSAQEAYDAGLVARVVPADRLGAAVDEVVAALLAGSAPALAAAKRIVREAAAPAPEAAMRRETLSIRTLVAGPDGQEGVAAFLGKRTPEFG